MTHGATVSIQPGSGLEQKRRYRKTARFASHGSSAVKRKLFPSEKGKLNPHETPTETSQGGHSMGMT